jgi:hypothetical protein
VQCFGKANDIWEAPDALRNQPSARFGLITRKRPLAPDNTNTAQDGGKRSGTAITTTTESISHFTEPLSQQVRPLAIHYRNDAKTTA